MLAPGFPGPSPDPDAVLDPTEPPLVDRNGQKPALVASHQDRRADAPAQFARDPGFEIIEEDDDEIIDLE
jgi:hypothetical protein